MADANTRDYWQRRMPAYDMNHHGVVGALRQHLAEHQLDAVEWQQHEAFDLHRSDAGTAAAYLDALIVELDDFHRHWEKQECPGVDVSPIARVAYSVAADVLPKRPTEPLGHVSYHNLVHLLRTWLHQLTTEDSVQSAAFPTTNHRARKRRIVQSNLSPGRITVTEAAKSYDVPSSTLHYWASKHPALQREKDPNTGVVTLSVSGLEDLLQAKERLNK